MKPLRLMDLDLLVQIGMKARPFVVKSGNNEVNLSAVQYVIERIACFIRQGMGVCILKQYPLNEDEIISCRDPLSRLCYEILSDKLDTMGICVKTLKSRQELEDCAYDIINRGYRGKNPFPTIRAIINCPKLYCIVDYTSSICIDSDISITCNTYSACDDEFDVPLGSYAMLYILKRYFKDNYGKLFEEYCSLGLSPKEIALPINMGNFLQSKCKSGDINASVAIKAVKDILTLYDFGKELPKEEFETFNMDGAEMLLTGFGLKTALEVLGIYDLEYTKHTKIINTYLKNKVEEYCSGEYSLNNGLSLETNYFLETSEKVVDKNGEVISTDRNDEFLSEEELINEFT